MRSCAIIAKINKKVEPQSDICHWSFRSQTLSTIGQSADETHLCNHLKQQITHQHLQVISHTHALSDTGLYYFLRTTISDLPVRTEKIYY